MYLMYVDESGDCGMPADGSPTRYFCLSGVVVHELRWRETMDQLLRFRHWLRGKYKIYHDDELHAAEMLNKPKKAAASLQRLKKHVRLAVIRKNADDRGIIFPDDTDGTKLKRYLDAIRLNNQFKIRQPQGAFVYRNEPIKVIVEDPVLRNSRDSYLIQVADCTAFLLKQSIQPSSFMKRHGGNAYFKRLDPVLCKVACNNDLQGVVRL